MTNKSADKEMIQTLWRWSLGALPAGTILILYGSQARGEATAESDVDLWLLHESETQRLRFVSCLGGYIQRLQRVCKTSVAVENDSFAVFTDRLQYGDPWSSHVARDGIAVLDPNGTWEKWKAGWIHSVADSPSKDALQRFFGLYATQVFEDTAAIGQQFFARLNVLLAVAAAAESVCDTGIRPDSEAGYQTLPWSGFVEAKALCQHMESISRESVRAGRFPDAKDWLAELFGQGDRGNRSAGGVADGKTGLG